MLTEDSKEVLPVVIFREAHVMKLDDVYVIKVV